MITVQELNQEFGNPGIRFYTDSHGLACAELNNPMGKAEIALHGAHLMSFIPKGQKAVLWMSEKSYFEQGKPIRGGIPICWPWFGGHPENPDMPSHGFARIFTWEPIAGGNCGDGATFLELALTPGLITDEFKSNDFLVKLRVEVNDKLSVALIIDNTGKKDLSYSAALHSYFNISDISNIKISGLDGKTFIDTLDNTTHVQLGDISFTAETDSVYLDTEDTCIIDDPGFKRKIKVRKTGSRSTVVWNPWDAKAQRMPDFGDNEFHKMVCVETTNAESDARTLAPNECHTLQVIIESETEG
ncbi:MAG: D-hexose-6-phosphate mutarotase [Victivallaceae bacterium]|nr:D-hexose-6-phosphate mutarotase [Victivallaceae bacterium]